MSRAHRTGLLLSIAARKLVEAVAALNFGPPVAHVYNPLSYAWKGYLLYLSKFAQDQKRVVFLGMNPGPFGMVQTGVPFGDVGSVKGWLGITAHILPPPNAHPRRPVLGFECPRCEVSGQRLWGLFRQRFGTSERFFAEHFVINYCPLAFMEDTGRNRTPDKINPEERRELYAACDAHLKSAIAALRPEWIVGIGAFAAERAVAGFAGTRVKLAQVLHPSPASPLANRNWAEVAERQLLDLGVWR